MASSGPALKILSRAEIDTVLACAICTTFPADILMCSSCGDLICPTCTETVDACPRCSATGPRTLFPARFAHRLAAAVAADFAASEASIQASLDASNKRIAETVLTALRTHVVTCREMFVAQLQAEQLNQQIVFLQQLQQLMATNNIPPSDPRVTMQQQQFMMTQSAQYAVRMQGIEGQLAELNKHVALVEAGLATHSFFNSDGTVAPCNPLFTFGKTSVWPEEAGPGGIGGMGDGLSSMGTTVDVGAAAAAASAAVDGGVGAGMGGKSVPASASAAAAAPAPIPE